MGAGNPSHLIAYAHATDQGGREAAGRHYLKAMKSTARTKVTSAKTAKTSD